MSQLIQKLEQEIGYSEINDCGKIEEVPVQVRLWEVDGRESLVVTIPLNRKFPNDSSPRRFASEAIQLLQGNLLELEYIGNELRIEFHNLSKVSPNDVWEIVRYQFNIAKSEDLIEIKGCICCGQEIEKLVFYDSDGICPNCSNRQIKINRTIEATINKPNPKLKGLIPLIFLLIPIGWGILFYTYYVLAEGNRNAGLTWFLVIALAAVLGITTGWPFGRIIRKSGAKWLYDDHFKLFLIVILGALLGEYLAVAAWAFKGGMTISFFGYLRWLQNISSGGSLIKGAMILGIFGGIYFGIQKKRVG